MWRLEIWEESWRNGKSTKVHSTLCKERMFSFLSVLLAGGLCCYSQRVGSVLACAPHSLATPADLWGLPRRGVRGWGGEWALIG